MDQCLSFAYLSSHRANVHAQVNPPRCPRIHHASTPPRPSSPPPSSPAQTSSKSHVKNQGQRRTSHAAHSVEDMNMANSGVAMNGGSDCTPLIKPDSHGMLPISCTAAL